MQLVNEQELNDYLRSTRQWHRKHRKNHARYNMRKAQKEKNKPLAAFHKAVLEALED